MTLRILKLAVGTELDVVAARQRAREISNGIKFAEAGEIAVRANVRSEAGMIDFHVSDTGLGMEARHLELIFEEFSQVENHLQAKVKGTGLGLPLCRKLADLLNGCVGATSVPGAGSVFTVSIPLDYVAPAGSVPPASNNYQ